MAMEPSEARCISRQERAVPRVLSYQLVWECEVQVFEPHVRSISQRSRERSHSETRHPQYFCR